MMVSTISYGELNPLGLNRHKIHNGAQQMMTKTRVFLFFVATAFTFPLTSAWAAERAPDAAHGKTLHSKSCMGCHDNSQYTRANRIIHTFEDLSARVKFCDAAANADFSPNDLNDVVEYLNADFYKFGK